MTEDQFKRSNEINREICELLLKLQLLESFVESRKEIEVLRVKLWIEGVAQHAGYSFDKNIDIDAFVEKEFTFLNNQIKELRDEFAAL